LASLPPYNLSIIPRANKRVYKRDGFKCVKCNISKNLDAHHIIPIVSLIRELLQEKKFYTEDEKLEFLVSHSSIKDDNLENGITLCRKCHKREHNNWGSKISP